MRKYPTDPEDFKDLESLNADDWMIELLKKNPDYVWWGSYEDYMAKTDKGWESRVEVETVDEGLWELDDYNELVHFYFEIRRSSKACSCCDGSGLNKETKQLDDDWYDFKGTGKRWREKLTQDEVDTLWEKGRLRGDFKEKPNANDVNIWAKKGFGHDAINQWYCVEARAKRLGIYGNCEECFGKGSIFTDPKPRVGLQLWILHPRKGCSRGVYIKDVQKEDIPKVINHLKKAKERNNERFSKL